ncbi:2-deoxy-5-keto-D-gluconate 6-phosphate aldolase domain-containing protein [Pseudonocardia xinjiangensis]|uniref:DUF2090 domain-containing protein n=1 Tax=Pseudonocardia xinjiangensis TaxID=75289 RepID=A0ABX1RGP9_9PSEU|nr:DUF2090 domain-containing protein [Pseudonocardia xinjiangensis]NMH78619.1 DUF2090 domain-containing protein [Pseudonocardia xinjiangensis]
MSTAPTTTPATVAPDLLILAMDHRASLARTVYDWRDPLTDEQAARIADGKQLVFAGLRAALDRGAPAGAGVLVDERFGAPVARAARGAGLSLAMPIERSGQEWFTLEYGSLSDGQWLEHVADFDPDYVKVLVRDNPGFDLRARREQQDALAQVTGELHRAGRRLLLELLVPPTPEQHENLGDDYDRALRPPLTEQVITDMQGAGAAPDIWKIEGLDLAEDAERVVAAARQGGRDDVRCVVLGRDADQSQLDRWLRVAAGVDGFHGFAIGRTIWEKPLLAHVRGELDETGVVDQVATAYRHYADTYHSA